MGSLALVIVACSAADHDGTTEARPGRTLPATSPSSPALSDALSLHLGRLAGHPAPRPPSPPDAAAGEGIYREQCDICHGPEGQGDGPLASLLQTTPANLQAHSRSGQPTDDQRFHVVAAGVPGTRMQGYADVLSVQEIWNVVAWLRRLGKPVHAPASAAETPQGAEVGHRPAQRTWPDQ